MLVVKSAGSRVSGALPLGSVDVPSPDPACEVLVVVVDFLSSDPQPPTTIRQQAPNSNMSRFTAGSTSGRGDVKRIRLGPAVALHDNQLVVLVEAHVHRVAVGLRDLDLVCRPVLVVQLDRVPRASAGDLQGGARGAICPGAGDRGIV